MRNEKGIERGIGCVLSDNCDYDAVEHGNFIRNGMNPQTRAPILFFLFSLLIPPKRESVSAIKMGISHVIDLDPVLRPRVRGSRHPGLEQWNKTEREREI